MAELTELGVAALRDGVRSGAFSAVEVADAFVVKAAKVEQRAFKHALSGNIYSSFVLELPYKPTTRKLSWHCSVRRKESGCQT